MSRAAMQMALDALVAMRMEVDISTSGLRACDAAIAALRTAVAQSEAQPVACQGLPDPRCKYLASCGTICNKCGRHHNATLYFLPSTAQQPALPEGWVAVPKVPTANMLEAARTACDANVYPQDSVCGPRAMNADRYRAMLDAAPAAAQEDGNE
jgi:hypothetical protein